MELDNYNRVAGPAFRSLEGMRYNLDPNSPLRELTYDPAAVEKQTRLVDEAHRLGAQVLASVHCLTRVSNEGVLQILRAAEDRHCDWVKIGRFMQSYEDIVDTLAQTVLLRRHAKMPFIMMGMGEYAKMPRLMGLCLGTCLVFCKQTYRAGSFTDQPLIRDAKKFLESIDYHITPRAQEYTLDWYLEGRDKA
jgi:3-dehydroquinate dehydratase